MKIGTKSVLFGAHCFLIHPWFVFIAWWKLYGFPFDPRLWVAFFVHDLGYWGKPNMDGAEGETHPLFGATIMHRLFDDNATCRFGVMKDHKWFDFCLYHSRFYAKKNGAQPSRLCIADKLAICLTPYWLYLPMVRMTGEINEYMKDSLRKEGDSPRKYASMVLCLDSQKSWYLSVQEYLLKWVDEHKDGKIDIWTPNIKEAINKEGVWK
jgi:hypothetical protein